MIWRVFEYACSIIPDSFDQLVAVRFSLIGSSTALCAVSPALFMQLQTAYSFKRLLRCYTNANSFCCCDSPLQSPSYTESTVSKFSLLLTKCKNILSWARMCTEYMMCKICPFRCVWPFRVGKVQFCNTKMYLFGKTIVSVIRSTITLI